MAISSCCTSCSVAVIVVHRCLNQIAKLVVLLLLVASSRWSLWHELYVKMWARIIGSVFYNEERQFRFAHVVGLPPHLLRATMVHNDVRVCPFKLCLRNVVDAPATLHYRCPLGLLLLRFPDVAFCVLVQV